MRPAQRKGLAQTLLDDYRISVRRACKLVFHSSSVWYYRSKRKSDAAVRQRIREIAETRIRYGFWRIYILLRREGWNDNHKRIYRIYREEGLNLRRKRPRRSKAAAHRQERPRIVRAYQCWSMDFVSDQLFNGRKFRCLTVVDNYSRYCMAIRPDHSIKGGDVVEVMNQIIERTGCFPERIQVDNGSEFISKVLDKWAYENNVILDFSRPGKPTDNPYIESFNGSFRDECLNVNWFLSLEDTEQKIEEWRNEYNQFRPHSSLNDKTPEQILMDVNIMANSLLLTDPN